MSPVVGGKKMIIETGKFAEQADGSCTVRYGDTVVLATAVMGKNQREGVDYLPLLVDYEERLYAAGKIKGSRFINREGRPSDEAILTSRLVDRSLRPLFDQAIRNDIQVIITVLSVDQENDPEIIALIAAALVTNAILGLSHWGFDGQPIAHTDHLWNFGGMVLAGLAFALAGCCPGRQFILSGEGDGDAAVFALGMVFGAGFAHTFSLASSPAGAAVFGPAAVVAGLVFCVAVGLSIREPRTA